MSEEIEVVCTCDGDTVHFDYGDIHISATGYKNVPLALDTLLDMATGY